MSQPEYPPFSKKYQYNKRGTYNFGRSKDFTLAEKWFKERLESSNEQKQEIYKTPSDTLKKQSINMPPGLSKSMTNIAFCKKCKNKILINNSLVYCCKSLFCFECFSLHNDTFNRCIGCKKIVNIAYYDLYDGLDLKIPSYEDFFYQDSF